MRNSLSPDELSRLKRFLKSAKSSSASTATVQWASHCRDLIREIRRLEAELDHLAQASEQIAAGRNVGDTFVA